MIDFVATAFATFFVVIDPVGILPLFLALSARMPPAQRRRTAIRAVSIAAATLIAFALAGDLLFRFLGISLSAFRIAGGLLLLLLSVDMILVRPSALRTATRAEEQEAEESSDIAVFPLAVPLIAGPGAITSVILITGRAGGDLLLLAVAILVLAVVLILCAFTFVAALPLMDRLGLTGVNVLSRIFGIVLAGLAVQYILDGLTTAFPILVGP